MFDQFNPTANVLNTAINPLSTPNGSNLALAGTSTGLTDPLQQNIRSASSASFSATAPGVFTVGATGKVSFDYLFDGGAYEGEVAIFDLTGMDRYFQAGSEFFAREAALRALTNTDFGHIVISDQTEGARLSGSLPYEGDFNSGTYTGAKTFTMQPGEHFGIMLVPNGKVEDILFNQNWEANQLPLFSIAATNPGQNTQFAQVVDVKADGNSFAFEDLRLDGHSDRDYNDMIFQVRGATGQATLLNNTINSLKDWRNSEIGQQVVTYATANKYGPLSKVGNDLAEVFSEYETHLRTGGSSVNFATDNFLLQTQNGRVVIDAFANGDTSKLLAGLSALGLKQSATFGVVVSGSIPIEAMNEVAVLDSLRFARPAYQPIARVGQVDAQGNTQGNRAINADLARNNFGINGAGVTVGVISDSYDTLALTPALNDVTSNDLPGATNTNGFTAPVRVLQEGTGGDEGRAMLQIIHDLAPGANLAFHTGTGGTANFAQGITELATVARANVIVDDLGIYTEPFFQDGILAQAVDQVVANGVAYFSAAGNDGRNSYESTFNAVPGTTPGTTLHDFDPGVGVDTRQTLTIPANTNFSVWLQWDSPFFSASPSSGGATNDLDMFLFDVATGNLLASSTNPNGANNAVEVLGFRNANPNPRQVELEIRNTLGANPGRIKYIAIGGTVTEHPTNSSTLFGQPNARNAMAVGAAFYGDTPNFGQAPSLIETATRVGEYGSSPGSTPILFDAAGNRLASPLIRQNHMIVAPDGVNTTFFGRDINATTKPAYPNSLDQDDSVIGNGDNDAFPNFFGTSAAAPHAAAVAALMLQAVPGANPQNIYRAMETTAIDMDTPGFDHATGFGLVQADAAIQAIQQLQPPTVTISASDNTAFEDGSNLGQFIVTRTGGSILNDLVVNYTSGGTATNFVDYSLNGSVIIPAGFSTVAIPIIPIDDMMHESNETVDIRLQPSPTSSYTIGVANHDTVTIVDNDSLTRQLKVSGSFYGYDDETFGHEELKASIAEQKIILPQSSSPEVLNQVFKWGGEVRVELSLSGVITNEFADIQITGSAKLFEGTDEDTDKLRATQPIDIKVPRRASNFSYPVRVSWDGGDYAEITLTFDNTFGSNEEGFSGYSN